jgi:DNA modification methylase
MNGQPYYLDEFVALYLGDCREILAEQNCQERFEPEMMIFTDPPYGVDYDGGTVVRDKLVGDDTFRCYHWLIPSLKIWEGPAYICCPDRSLPTVVRLAGDDLRSVIVWRKQAQYGALSAHYKQANEFIAYIVPKGGKSLWTGPTNETTDWEYPRSHRTVHPTEKPLTLATRAIGNHSATLVLDMYAGSGTTLLAARQLKRKAIGIEIDERYCEIAAERLAQRELFT